MKKTDQYLLDTNIISDLIRNPSGMVAKMIAEVGATNVFTSIVVSSEIRFGIAKKNSDNLTRQAEAILSEITILPLEEPVDYHYAKIRNKLAQIGMPIGPNDLFIAAQALALGLIVVTANVKEFSRVPRLPVDNWLLPH